MKRPVDVAVMESLLRRGADRCCYCQRQDYTAANPKVNVGPTLTGLVAHKACHVLVEGFYAEAKRV